MTIELTDDGTLDTVLRCSDCGAEMRYNYDPAGAADDLDQRVDDYMEDHKVARGAAIDAIGTAAYDAFVDWAIEDATADHECEPEDTPDPGTEDRLMSLGFDRGSRGCSQCAALSINGIPAHETGCPNQTFECKGCNARVSRKGAYCEDCR